VAERRPLEIVGHGGAGPDHPGNSRAAIEAGLALGADRIECDVQRARDGELVLVHDDRVPLPGGERRAVRDLATAELRGLLPGLLTIDEVAELVAGRAPLMLDVKYSGYERELIAAIRRHGLAGESSVSSTYPAVLVRVRRALPGMRVGLSTGHWATGAPGRLGRGAATLLLRATLPVVLPRALCLIGATEAMVQHRAATRRLVEAVHARGKRVNVWTVDSPRGIERALGLGVDGIISNRPDRVRELVGKAEGGRAGGADTIGRAALRRSTNCAGQDAARHFRDAM
jgi:glycerophosphoryl diester phosphodiesterase